MIECQLFVKSTYYQSTLVTAYQKIRFKRLFWNIPVLRSPISRFLRPHNEGETPAFFTSVYIFISSLLTACGISLLTYFETDLNVICDHLWPEDMRVTPLFCVMVNIVF